MVSQNWSTAEKCSNILPRLYSRTYSTPGNRGMGKRPLRQIEEWGGGQTANRGVGRRTLTTVGMIPGTCCRIDSKVNMTSIMPSAFNCSMVALMMAKLPERPTVTLERGEGEIETFQTGPKYLIRSSINN